MILGVVAAIIAVFFSWPQWLSGLLIAGVLIEVVIEFVGGLWWLLRDGIRPGWMHCFDCGGRYWSRGSTSTRIAEAARRHAAECPAKKLES